MLCTPESTLPLPIREAVTSLQLADTAEQEGRDAVAEVLRRQALGAVAGLDVGELVDTAIGFYDQDSLAVGHVVMQLAAAAAERRRDAGQAGYGQTVPEVSA